MAGEVDVFVLDIRKFCQKAKGNIDAAVRKIAFDLFTRIVFHTPVDTGRLRGNWQVAWDNPTMAQLDRTDKGGGSTLDAGLTVLNQMGSVAGHSIWFSNHLPYAIPI